MRRVCVVIRVGYVVIRQVFVVTLLLRVNTKRTSLTDALFAVGYHQSSNEERHTNKTSTFSYQLSMESISQKVALRKLLLHSLNKHVKTTTLRNMPFVRHIQFFKGIFYTKNPHSANMFADGMRVVV